jgi:cell division cycle 2-like protein
LTYDPTKRIPAEEALKHEFFKETPLPVDPEVFPTWPARSEGFNKPKSDKDSEPKAPSAGKAYDKLIDDDEGFALRAPLATGFTLKF